MHIYVYFSSGYLNFCKTKKKILYLILLWHIDVILIQIFNTTVIKLFV